MSVKRYEPRGPDTEMVEWYESDYVKYTDYAALEQELAKIQKSMDYHYMGITSDKLQEMKTERDQLRAELEAARAEVGRMRPIVDCAIQLGIEDHGDYYEVSTYDQGEAMIKAIDEYLKYHTEAAARALLGAV